jgi:manganese-dependent inorganic pyrophosphatase
MSPLKLSHNIYKWVVYTKTMNRMLREAGYTAFLFMIVDIINMHCTPLVCGAEQPIAEVFAHPLEADGHTLSIEGLVSRKKQVVQLLPRIHALVTGSVTIA